MNPILRAFWREFLDVYNGNGQEYELLDAITLTNEEEISE